MKYEIIFIKIKTDRLILRGWKTENYLDLYEFASDEKIAECAGRRIIKD